ncbi:MAG: ATP-binding cassette subfamily B bacterial, partial [Chitinophagaceae bacterium]
MKANYFMFRKEIKIRQRDITDCGAACLASVAAFYRLYIPVGTIRLSAGTDKLGTNVLGMVRSAEKLGFRAKGARGNAESLPKIPFPSIAHLLLKNGLQHFVVIYKVTKKCIWLMDPADGRVHKKNISLFLSEWTGVLILLIPGDNFISGGKRITNLNRLWYLIQPHKNILFQALLGALIYTILGLSTSFYVQKLIDRVLVDGDIQLLRLLSIGMIVILFFQFIIANNKSILGLQTGQQIDVRLILGYYRHLLALPQRFFDTMRTGEVLSRINDAVKIRLFINDVALSLVVNFFIILFSVSMFFFYYWKLAV